MKKTQFTGAGIYHEIHCSIPVLCQQRQFTSTAKGKQAEGKDLITNNTCGRFRNNIV
jgi:hypothetical protein